MRRLQCAEIWGGTRNADSDVCSAGLTASLFSLSCDGGKGGDIYYFSVCGGDRLTRIAIADVVGHGEKVSDVSAWLYDSLESNMNNPAGSDILKALNSLALERGMKALTTAAIVSYSADDSHAYFSYAGHHPMLICRIADGDWTAATLIETGGGMADLPLGVDSNVAFTQSSVRIKTGDRMLLYTDGVLEAPSEDGTLFGESRLLSTLQDAGRCTLAEIKNAVLHAVRAHTGGSLTHDDVSLLVVELN